MTSASVMIMIGDSVLVSPDPFAPENKNKRDILKLGYTELARTPDSYKPSL
jgi:hypothetical protein